ncbi:hypothetical protein [Nocardia sp. CA-145437]|uniref:hypothetical protein n=1 Tax=Nocardia sp. CA-145437 TaxID=3239980 RepID=UPI003D9593AC
MKHNAADPNDPLIGVAEVAGGAAAVVSAPAAGAAKTSKGAANTVAATVFMIFLDILLPYHELLWCPRLPGCAAELADVTAIASHAESALRHPIGSSVKQ